MSYDVDLDFDGGEGCFQTLFLIIFLWVFFKEVMIFLICLFGLNWIIKHVGK